MVEPVGATLGSLGLVGLLTVSLNCFDFMHSGNSLGRDFVLLEGQLSGLRIRLFAWSKACGFMDPDGYNPRIDHPNWRHHISTQLNCISSLFLDAAKLVKRYDLEKRYQQHANSPGSPNVDFIEEGLKGFLLRMKTTKRRGGFTGAFLWALKDKKDFTEMLQRSKECIEALELVTKNLDLFESQRRVINYEISSISDTTTLESMIASKSAGDVISDAASQRLVELQTSAETGSRTETFHTAPSHFEEAQREAVLAEERAAEDGSTTSHIDQHVRIMNEMLQKSPRKQQIPLKFGQEDLTWGDKLEALRLADAEKLPKIRFRERFSPFRSQLGSQRWSQSWVRKLMVTGREPRQPWTAALVGDRADAARVTFEGPPGSPYQGGVFHMLLQFPEGIPFKPPIVRMLTRTYHANIDARGRICVDMLGAAWSPAFWPFSYLAVAICSLLTEPTLENPLVPDIAALYVQDPEQYAQNAKAYIERYATLDQDISNERLLLEMAD